MNETFIPPELQEVIVGTQGKVPSIRVFSASAMAAML